LSKKIIKPIDVIPFKINNLEDFVPDSQYPIFHPKSKAYGDYWDIQTENSLFGIWGDDSRKESEHSQKEKIGGFRWLPPQVTFYTHHLVIQKESEEDLEQTGKGAMRPDQRDVEFFLGYDQAAYKGFAGFSDDKYFTAFRPVGKIERGEKLTNSDKVLLERYEDKLRDKYGKYKKYMDARHMLYRTTNEPLGKPLWFNENQNYMLLSTRRLGKSYFKIGTVAIYNMTFNGARTLEQFKQQKTQTTTVVGSGNTDKTKEFFAKFNQMYDHLRSNVGSYRQGKKEWAGAWWWKTEGSVATENSFMTNAVKAEGKGAGLVGPGSRIWHVTYAKSPSKGAGTSSDDSLIEEVGLTPNPEDIHAENAPTQRSDFKFGSSEYIGTGGDFEMIEGSKKMFFNPLAYDILPCQNLFDAGGKDTARFVPATYYPNQFRDENGNQDTMKAWEDIMSERDIKETLDTRQYLRHKSSYPLTHHEIFVKYDGNNFPIKHLEERLTSIKNGAVAKSVGKILFNDSQNLDAFWVEDLESKPLMELEDLTDDNVNKTGAIVQYETPNRDKPKRIPGNKNPMYLVFVEPVRNETGTSYVYAYVWKFYDYKNPERMQNNIVCEWFGRFDNNNDANLRRVFDMAAYYGANIFAEINNDAIIGTARRIKRYDWLQPSLGYVEGLEVNSKKEYPVGKYVAPGENPGLEKLTNTWLRQSVSFTEKITADGYVREEVMLADTLNSQMVCSQLIAYNRDGNYDAYDGIRLKALWDKANEGVEAQFSENERETKLLQMMKRLQQSRGTRRKRAY